MFNLLYVTTWRHDATCVKITAGYGEFMLHSILTVENWNIAKYTKTSYVIWRCQIANAWFVQLLLI